MAKTNTGWEFSFVVKGGRASQICAWLRAQNINFYFAENYIHYMNAVVATISLPNEEDAIITKLAWSEYLL